jgi:hypothetical protein
MGREGDCAGRVRGVMDRALRSVRPVVARVHSAPLRPPKRRCAMARSKPYRVGTVRLNVAARGCMIFDCLLNVFDGHGSCVRGIAQEHSAGGRLGFRHFRF